VEASSKSESFESLLRKSSKGASWTLPLWRVGIATDAGEAIGSLKTRGEEEREREQGQRVMGAAQREMRRAQGDEADEFSTVASSSKVEVDVGESHLKVGDAVRTGYRQSHTPHSCHQNIPARYTAT
jgi:hypothetical protein